MSPEIRIKELCRFEKDLKGDEMKPLLQHDNKIEELYFQT